MEIYNQYPPKAETSGCNCTVQTTHETKFILVYGNKHVHNLTIHLAGVPLLLRGERHPIQSNLAYRPTCPKPLAVPR